MICQMKNDFISERIFVRFPFKTDIGWIAYVVKGPNMWFYKVYSNAILVTTRMSSKYVSISGIYSFQN